MLKSIKGGIMAFFMSMKGVLHPYTFHYLSKEADKVRLEPTLIHGQPKKDQDKKHEDQIKEFFAIDIMSKKIVSLDEESPLQEVKNLMQKNEIRHIPIIGDKKFKGIISDRDLLKVDMSGTFNFLKAKDVMSDVVVIADEETTVAHLAKVFLMEKISCMPIINQKHNLSGMVTRSDILSVIVNNQLILRHDH